jgi:phospholipase C
VYEGVTANKDRWKKTVMIVYYDEHGGFWDHEPPPAIPYKSRQAPAIQCTSMGPRIPALVVSPLVVAGSVCRDLFDHSSVLQFLAERFTPGLPYSPDVDARRNQGVRSLSDAFTQDAVREDIPLPPPAPIPVDSELGRSVEPTDELSKAFERAARRLMEEHPAETGKKFPELFQWRSATDRARGA